MVSTRNGFRPFLERLDERIVPYAVTGYKWANTNVSASFMPDGTMTDNGSSSNLFGALNAIAPTATWQREFARALQTWANVTPLNFRFVVDNGAAWGTSGSAQGDGRFGDIRIGGESLPGWAGYTYYPSGSTGAGDAFFGTQIVFSIGGYPDLYSVGLHEFGHSLGLDHSSVSNAIMYPSIWGTYTGLSADDIAGIQAIYGARRADSYDGSAGNDSFGSATALNLNGSGAVTLTADLTTMADVDVYRITAPSGDGTLTVSVDARNLSLTSPKVSVYDGAGNLIGTASATTYAGVATLTLNGLAAGQTYYLVADGATSDAFGMGAYKLSAQFAGVVQPTLPSLSINNVSLTEGDGGTKAFAFTVLLSAASVSIVSVQYSTANGTATASSDYVTASGELTFAPGETQKTFSVLVNGDTTYEPNESFFVNLSVPTNAVLGNGQGTGTVQNDDLGPDRYEANDTAATATNFGRNNGFSQTGLTLHTASDVDHYAFTPSKSGTFRITVSPTQGTGTLNLTLLDAQQNVIANGQAASGTVAVTANLTGGRLYYVQVASSTGSLLTYSLSVARSTGKGGAATIHGVGEIGDGTEVLPRGFWYTAPKKSSQSAWWLGE